MNMEQTNNRSLLYGISINAKDKLIWSGSYEALQMFVEEVLNMSDDVWDCPGLQEVIRSDTRVVI